MLSVASMEERYIRLAGPKILSRLTGEAWRATEHLSIQHVRGEDGWLRVVRALAAHYKYLPETELNDCVDEFMFHLKRKQGEGPTAFVSRFRTALNRLESLIAADRAVQSKRRKKERPKAASPPTSSSSKGTSDISSLSGLGHVTAENVSSAAAAAAADGADPDGQAGSTKGPKTVGSFVGESPKRKAPSASSRGSGRGTQKGDDDKAQRKHWEPWKLAT